jgi:hypothetical protein
MWKLAAVTASVFICAACDTTERAKQLEQREQLETAKAEREAIAQIDDARCRSYGAPGTEGYFQCRSTLMNGRRSASDNRSDAKKP